MLAVQPLLCLVLVIRRVWARYDMDTMTRPTHEHHIQSLPPPIVTFIVPTTGRASLLRTIQSVTEQTSPRWELMVVVDGVFKHSGFIHATAGWLTHAVNTNDSTGLYGFVHVTDALLAYSQEPRVKFWSEQERIGSINYGGALRNIGMMNCKTRWAAFVDDDDVVRPPYVECLLRLSERYPIARVLIFRMVHGRLIIPPPNTTDFEINRVGISFAVEASICKKEGVCFQPGGREDFFYLNALRSAGHVILLTPYVMYRVRGDPGRVPYIKGELVMIHRTNGVTHSTLLPDPGRHRRSHCLNCERKLTFDSNFRY